MKRFPLARILCSVLLPIALLALLALTACQQPPRYEAQIRRTSYGIPHIEAKNLGSLGFGEGYAIAEDHLCSIADQIVRARGERAKYFGVGEKDEYLLSDAAMKGLGVHESAAELAGSDSDLRQWFEGYVAGYNKYLQETGKDNVPGWCKGADWVFPITLDDLAGYQRIVTLITAQFFNQQIASVEPPPTEPAAPTAGALAEATPAFADESFRDFERSDVLTWDVPALGASNGWGLGSDWSESGHGMLLANPHYPWAGSNRFWEKHLRIPGELDVYGAGLIAIPGVAIGFNRAVGWTHTVSAGKRYTLYALRLVEGDPMKYHYGDEERSIEERKVMVEVKQGDGTLANIERSIYFSHYGPLVNFGNLSWSPQMAFAIRDANQDNEEGRAQWLAMDRAKSMQEFQAVHAKYEGMPWVNTISTSAEGVAWYTDGASTPNLSDEALALYDEKKVSDPLAGALAAQGIVLLDGSDPRFEWQADPDARDPGVVSAEKAPQLERRDYVFNANDSFWLANSSAPIEGDYSPLRGDQRTQRSLRTRNNDLTLSLHSPDQPAGENKKFSLEEMQHAILSNRSYTAEILLPELIERCSRRSRVSVDGSTTDLSTACDVLAAWDKRFDLASRGAVLFREWIGQYPGSDLQSGGHLFMVPFDPANPIETPRGLAGPSREGDLALQNLARAVRLLESRDIALDAPLGELQYADKNGRHIPVHGGHGAYEGVMNMQQVSANQTTLEPQEIPRDVEGSRFLTEGGYPIGHGSSFLLTLEYTDAGPHAEAFLTYSESGDPQSPHFADQTELYAKKQWRPVLFLEADIAADVQRSYTVSGE